MKKLYMHEDTGAALWADGHPGKPWHEAKVIFEGRSPEDIPQEDYDESSELKSEALPDKE